MAANNIHPNGSNGPKAAVDSTEISGTTGSTESYSSSVVPYRSQNQTAVATDSTSASTSASTGASAGASTDVSTGASAGAPGVPPERARLSRAEKGVLVYSEFAGCASSFKGALVVNPYDADQVRHTW